MLWGGVFEHWRHKKAVIVITARASKIVMEMKHRSVHCTTFSILSAQNALDTALFQQVNSRIHRKHGPVYRYPQAQDWVRKSRHSTCSSAGCLMRWCSLLKPHPAQSLTSYFTRCSHAWAWDPALYIYPCKASCLLHDEGWRMLRASETHPFPEERGGPAWLPQGKHPEGCRRSNGETWQAIYRAGKEEWWGKMRGGGSRQEEKRHKSLKADDRVWYLWLTVSTEIWADVVCSTCWTEQISWLVAHAAEKADQVCSTYWFMAERVHAEVSCVELKSSETEQRE